MERPQRWAALGWLFLLMAIGVNLRPLVAAVSPLLEEIQASTQVGYSTLAWMTTIPFLCMGGVALQGARFQAWLGVERGVALALGGIMAACLLRLWGDDAFSLLSTALVGGIGIALIQALLPGMVKARFGEGMPLAMGLYSAALMSGGGIAALLSPWLAAHYGSWKLGIGIWWVPALLAMLAWVRIAGVRGPGPGAGNEEGAGRWSWRRAWLLAIYFGLINAGYTSVIAWLATYYRELGWTAQQGGNLLAWMTLFQVAAAVVMPGLAQRQARPDRRRLLGFSLVVQLIGYVALVVWPTQAAWLWVGLIGFGLGACFVLGLILALDHSRDPVLAGRMAAFMQGIGFVITALSAWLSGVAREWSGGFELAWLLLALGVVAMLVVTRRFDPARY